MPNKEKSQALPGKAEPILKEVILNAPVSMVWKAITDKDEMKKWYFDFKEFKPEIGFEFRFYGGPPEKQYLHICKITEVISEKELKYSWKYDGYTGISFVTFKLLPEGNKTTLKLIHEGIESFPTDIPDFAKKNFEEGWTHIIHTSLKEYFGKQ